MCKPFRAMIMEKEKGRRIMEDTSAGKQAHTNTHLQKGALS